MASAADLMTTKMITAHPKMGLQEFAMLLERKKISGAPVVDDEGVVVGVISKSDLTRARAQGDNLVDLFYQSAAGVVGGDSLLDDEYSPYGDADEVDGFDELCVGDVMNRNVFSIEAKTGLNLVARSMLDKKIHRLLVTDSGRFVGIISATDLLRALAEAPAREGELVIAARDVA